MKISGNAKHIPPPPTKRNDPKICQDRHMQRDISRLMIAIQDRVSVSHEALLSGEENYPTDKTRQPLADRIVLRQRSKQGEYRFLSAPPQRLNLTVT